MMGVGVHFTALKRYPTSTQAAAREIGLCAATSHQTIANSAGWSFGDDRVFGRLAALCVPSPGCG
jgi:hypothetical protein